MPPMKHTPRHGALPHFTHDEDGATSIEYALIAAAIGLMLILVMPGVSTSLQGLLSALASGLSGTNSSAG